MLSPDVMVIDVLAPDGWRRIGEYLCRIDYQGEPLGRTLDIDGHWRTIHSGVPYMLDGDRDLVELTIIGKEMVPIIGLGDTRIAITHGDRALWRRLNELSGRESVVHPVLNGRQWMLCEGAIKSLKRHRESLPRMLPDMKPSLMSLYLDAGKGKSYWCPGGIVHV